MGFFVDIHSHVVPSGDDGAADVGHGRALCVSAFRHGTAVLYATPHVWPELPLTERREAAIRAVYAEQTANLPLELRLGFELTPAPRLLDEDPARYRLEGTDAVLVEVPFVGSARLLVAVAEHVERAGLRPVIAHPERGDSVAADPSLASEFVERGWPLQVNGSSLLGRHGPAQEALGWQLVDDGLAALVASDGHRETRPPHLDEAYRAVVGRVGETRARSLFDGSALNLPAGHESARADSRPRTPLKAAAARPLA